MNPSDFIVHYPVRDDTNYDDEMGAKLEFRELIVYNKPGKEYIDEPFYYNYQALIGRWWAPWTNNRIGLIRWDPGSGKTRGALNFALTWMKNSNHKKAIIISTSDIVLRAMEDEVVKYNDFDLEGGVYKQGRRAHGKTLRKSKYVKKQGFVKKVITSFMNDQERKFNEDKLKGGPQTFEEYLRETFKGYVVIIDEVHTLRSVGKDKAQHRNIMIFLDAVRPVCPILLMTATPVVNSWQDVFSIIGMMYPPKVRAEIESQIKNIKVLTSDPKDIELIRKLVYQYSRGLVSDRKSLGVVPAKVSLPSPFSEYKFEVITSGDDSTAESTLTLKDNIFPVFMSPYQTEYTAILEEGRGLKSSEITSAADMILEQLSSKNNLYINLREAYDFAAPFVQGEERLGEKDIRIDLTYKDSSTGFDLPNTEKAIIETTEGEQENIFEIVWVEPFEGQVELWNDVLRRYYEKREIIPQSPRYKLLPKNVKFPSLEKGLGKYAIKYAMLIWLMKYHPLLVNIPGYVHTLWVKVGTKLIAAALNTNGWEQYTGKGPINGPIVLKDENGVEYIKPRFAIIDGNTKPTHMSNIIEAFNSEKNKDGSILKMILGSRKSGISVSFTNGQFFLELSPDFNKATSIQSEGRVFRADSLSWLKGTPDRHVFTADIVALPSINPGNQEINEEYISDISNGFLRNKSYITYEVESSTTTTTSTRQRTYSINPVTIEVRMYQLSEIKYSLGRVAMEALELGSIEKIIENSVSIFNKKTDVTTHALLYSSRRRGNIKAKMLETIFDKWVYPLNINNMYSMRTAAELVSNHAIATTRYGMMRPIQSFSNIITATRDPGIVPISSGAPSSLGQLSLIYDRNFFLVEEQRGYPPEAVRNTIALISKAPTERFEFYKYLSEANVGDSKAIALELALVIPSKTLQQQEIMEVMKRRELITTLYANFWDAFGGGRLVHVLWYGTKSNSYLKKIGIDNSSMLKTRIITYNPSTVISVPSETENKWKYIESTEREAVYLSTLSRNILILEENARKNAEQFGYYVHFSVYDGELRLKETYMDDKRKSKTVVADLISVPDVISHIMNTDINILRQRYDNNILLFKRDFFYRAEKLGILIIR